MKMGIVRRTLDLSIPGHYRGKEDLVQLFIVWDIDIFHG